jgi:putative aldouronate transport system substrate-binding protein
MYLNKLYNEGLIDPEVFTHDSKQYMAKGKAPEILYGVFFDWFDELTVGDIRAKNDYIALPPLKGSDGKQRWNVLPTALLERRNFAITNKMKNPEVAIRWADQCYDWATSFELVYGTWGENIKKDGNKVIMLPPPAGMSVDDFRYRNSPAYTTPFALYEVDFKNIQFTDNHLRKFVRLDMYRQYFPALEEVYPAVFFFPEEESELAILRTDINNYVDQMRAKFVVGSESVDAGWDNYVKQLNQMGLPKYLELHQKALARYYK